MLLWRLIRELIAFFVQVAAASDLILHPSFHLLLMPPPSLLLLLLILSLLLLCIPHRLAWARVACNAGEMPSDHYFGGHCYAPLSTPFSINKSVDAMVLFSLPSSYKLKVIFRCTVIILVERGPHE